MVAPHVSSSTKVTIVNPIESVFALLRVTRGDRWQPFHAKYHAPLQKKPRFHRHPDPVIPRPRPLPDLAAYLEWRGLDGHSVVADAPGGVAVLGVSNVPSDFALP